MLLVDLHPQQLKLLHLLFISQKHVTMSGFFHNRPKILVEILDHEIVWMLQMLQIDSATTQAIFSMKLVTSVGSAVAKWKQIRCLYINWSIISLF